jgi:hypothetical protein
VGPDLRRPDRRAVTRREVPRPTEAEALAEALLVRREPGRERGRGRGEGETRDHVDRVVATTQPQKNPPSTGPWNWDSR